MTSFRRRTRELLEDDDVLEQGTLRIKNTNGALLTSKTVINGLEKRKARKDQKAVRADNITPLR